jgi:hypothetical protein
MTVVIQTPVVPQMLWLELVYNVEDLLANKQTPPVIETSPYGRT